MCNGSSSTRLIFECTALHHGREDTRATGSLQQLDHTSHATQGRLAAHGLRRACPRHHVVLTPPAATSRHPTSRPSSATLISCQGDLFVRSFLQTLRKHFSLEWARCPPVCIALPWQVRTVMATHTGRWVGETCVTDLPRGSTRRRLLMSSDRHQMRFERKTLISQQLVRSNQ